MGFRVLSLIIVALQGPASFAEPVVSDGPEEVAFSSSLDSDDPSGENLLIRSFPGWIAGGRLKWAESRTARKGVSIRNWKQSFIHHFRKKLKHAPSEELLVLQEVLLNRLVRELVEKYVVGEEIYHSVSIDSRDLRGLRISQFRPVREELFTPQLKEGFRDRLLCDSGYCFIPHVFKVSHDTEISYREHHIKIGSHRAASPGTDCFDFSEGGSGFRIHFKTPRIEFSRHRRFLLISRMDAGNLLIEQKPDRHHVFE
jgi:hypothetical protein